MGANNGNPQAALSPNDLSGGGMSSPATAMQGSYMSPLQMPQAAASMPTGGADQSTLQYANNMRYLQDKGFFKTPYQKAMEAHPVLMGLANGMQAFGQGITKQPFYTGNQENQASLQNSQAQGVMNAISLPQQLKLMQAMYGMNAGTAGANVQPTNIPGVPTPNNTAVISTPGGKESQWSGKTPSGISYRQVS